MGLLLEEVSGKHSRNICMFLLYQLTLEVISANINKLHFPLISVDPGVDVLLTKKVELWPFFVVKNLICRSL